MPKYSVWLDIEKLIKDTRFHEEEFEVEAANPEDALDIATDLACNLFSWLDIDIVDYSVEEID